MKELVGRAAIVTGAGSGIGKSIAQAYAEEGASVVVAEKSPERAQDVAARIQVRGGDAVSIVTDVSRFDSVDEMVKKTLDRFGKIDILVNNAGIGWLSG